jgi:intraflagellar transport protein 88
VHRLLEDGSSAVEWLQQALSVSQSDPRLLQELGNMYDLEGDKSAAFQHHYDSYKIFPGDIQVIEWLASYYIESQFPEKAANYFNRASIIEPNEVKWHLMNASCLRKIGENRKNNRSFL